MAITDNPQANASLPILNQEPQDSAWINVIDTTGPQPSTKRLLWSLFKTFFTRVTAAPGASSDPGIAGDVAFSNDKFFLHNGVEWHQFKGDTNFGANPTVMWNDITSKPTTLGGYGIVDAFDGDFGSLSNKPTTVAGYGIVDAFDGIFSSLTGKPTTTVGYGITDALVSATLNGSVLELLNSNGGTLNVDFAALFTGATNLAASYSTTQVTVQSSSGTDVTLNQAGGGNAGVMSNADKNKLDAIEAGATADQTSGEIKSLYESEFNTNAYTDAEKSKLGAIEAGATADQSAAEIEAAYNAQVAQASLSEKNAGIATAIRRFSPKDIADMVAAHDISVAETNIAQGTGTLNVTQVSKRVWIAADCSLGNVIINLPSAPAIGDYVTVEDATLTVSNPYFITVNATNALLIDNLPSLVFDTLDEQGFVLNLRFNGTLWKIL
jgi:hypothetical protein